MPCIELLNSKDVNNNDNNVWLTSTKGEEPGGHVGQQPGVSTELEQVVGEHLHRPDAQPGSVETNTQRGLKIIIPFNSVTY